jgi:hypothetical protein
MMLGDYDLAATTYHTIKKDLNSDKQWKQFAAAQVRTLFFYL